MCWWMLYSSCNLFIFVHICVNVYLCPITFFPFDFWPFPWDVSSLYYFISETARIPSGLQYPCGVVILNCQGGGWGVTHLISAKSGWDIIQLKAKRDTIGKQCTMLFVYCTCLLGGMLKVAALSEREKLADVGGD